MIFSKFQIIVIFQIYRPWRDIVQQSGALFFPATYSPNLYIICISLTNKVSNVFASFFKLFQQVAGYSESASLFFTHNTFLDFYFPIASYIIIKLTCVKSLLSLPALTEQSRHLSDI